MQNRNTAGLVFVFIFALVGLLFISGAFSNETPMLPDYKKAPYEFKIKFFIEPISHPEFGVMTLEGYSSSDTSEMIVIFFDDAGGYKLAEWVLISKKDEQGAAIEWQMHVFLWDVQKNAFLFEKTIHPEQ